MGTHILTLTSEDLFKAIRAAALRHYRQAVSTVEMEPVARSTGPAFHVRLARPDNHPFSAQCVHHQPCWRGDHAGCEVVHAHLLEPELSGGEGTFDSVTTIRTLAGDPAGAAFVLKESAKATGPLNVWVVAAPLDDGSHEIMSLTVLADPAKGPLEVVAALKARLSVEAVADKGRARAHLDALDGLTVAVRPIRGAVHRPWAGDVAVTHTHAWDYDLTETAALLTPA